MKCIDPKVPVKELKNGDVFLAYHSDYSVHVWQIEDDTIVKEGNVEYVKSVKDISSYKKQESYPAVPTWPVQPILLVNGHVRVTQEN